MKNKILFIFLMLTISSWMPSKNASAQNVSVSFQLFYDELSPYGTWIDNPQYGYVWMPDVNAGFRPYATNGYWVFTDEGWTWVSNYPWGWAPFHYGRWYNDDSYGPIWVPGNEWGPGWVTWRRSAGYYGWAPIAPGISISVAYGNGYNVPYNQWTCVRDRDFGRRNINNYYVNNSNNVTIINNSTVIINNRNNRDNNITYNGGPDRREVEKHMGRNITPVSIRETTKPGVILTKNQLQVYRPQIQKNGLTTQNPTPKKVLEIRDIKTLPERIKETPRKNTSQPGKPQTQTQGIVRPVKQQPIRQQSNTTPVRQQQTIEPAAQQPTPTRGIKPVKQTPVRQQPVRQQQIAQPVKQQTNEQPSIQQPTRPTPVRQQPTPPRNVQPAMQQPVRQQPVRQQPNAMPVRQQPSPPRNVQPAMQQPVRQQQNTTPVRQQPSTQPERAPNNNPSNNKGEGRREK